MISLVAVSSRRNRRMLRTWRKLQNRDTLQNRIARAIFIAILAIAIITVVTTALGGF